MKRIIYVGHDQLNSSYGALKRADPKSDLIVLVESARMVTGSNWNKVRLYFLISSAHHFAKELTDSGFKVIYQKAATTVDGLKQVRAEHGDLPIIAASPNSFRLSKALADFGVTFIENDFFLTSKELFTTWAESQKSYLMENFYRGQRIRLNILVENGKPVGGAWNFDKENRSPLPKGYTFPPYLEHKSDEIDQMVAKQLGIEPNTTWATSRVGAKKVLKNFLDNHFENFGPYEDAMTSDNWALHHSLLSPYLNNGLLHPAEVLDAAVKRFEKGDIPIQSAEGFIRQIIGWREYVNGMYWYLGQDYKELNHLKANRKLLPLFNDPDKTKMNCIKTTVSDINQRGWVAHIPRLMLLSNLALITGTNPQQFLQWMREVFIDAADWVMVPNVIGMGVHADNGVMMTKPYAAGGAYISKMSNYCKGCVYDPKLRTTDAACPFTTLYWDFLDRNIEEFKGNHRMAQQLFGINRLKDMDQVRQRAKAVLTGLDNGLI
ncbi:MAG: cryptochrome/photolyase family protein [Actinobacteria bacterium]|nr:cryptochrome/photolyase family protein [Actinomycetota bacterium]